MIFSRAVFSCTHIQLFENMDLTLFVSFTYSRRSPEWVKKLGVYVVFNDQKS
jgi:hypothetical protein